MCSDAYLRLAAALASARYAMLASSGPSTVQASLVPCAARGFRLYIAVPCASAHLRNIAQNLLVVLMTARWQVRGTALAAAVDAVGDLVLRDRPAAQCRVLLEVRPSHAALMASDGWAPAETIALGAEWIADDYS